MALVGIKSPMLMQPSWWLAHTQSNSTSDFLRRADRDSLQTSANLAINDRFQVSLQPGNYSNLLFATWHESVSIQITGAKIQWFY